MKVRVIHLLTGTAIIYDHVVVYLFLFFYYLIFFVKDKKKFNKVNKNNLEVIEEYVVPKSHIITGCWKHSHRGGGGPVCPKYSPPPKKKNNNFHVAYLVIKCWEITLCPPTPSFFRACYSPGKGYES